MEEKQRLTGRQKTKMFFGCFVILLYLFFLAWSDYTWEDRATKDIVKGGYVVFQKRSNFADFFHPWTIVKTPVTGLWFLNPVKIVWLDKDVAYYQYFYQSWTYDENKLERFRKFVNCKTHEDAYLEENQKVEEVNWKDLRWSRYEDVISNWKVCNVYAMHLD